VTPARRWLAAALAALFATWLVAPAAVPIYDGIGNPDEPYRYVAPPQGYQKTKPPTVDRAVIAVRGGHTGAGFANSGEQAPQISIYTPAAAFDVPAAATSVTVVATPEAPKPPLPRAGTIWSNVYDITATADGQPVTLSPLKQRQPTIQMRAPTGQQPAPVFEHFGNGVWTQFPTTRVGVDVYQVSPVPALGKWALVRLAHPPTAAGTGGGVNVPLLGGGIALLVVAGVILAIRIRRAAAA
jgi:hypothetical protein